MNYENDDRVVLTLDAGGTNFVFVAMKSGRQLGESVRLPSQPRDLDKAIATIKEGFNTLIKNIGEKPAAISFAFPGPADYPKGIIYNVGNLPAFAGGVALADILEDEFKVPVFINNDGDLFVYGEALAGFLPYVNSKLEEAGSAKRYKKLFGVTLGTGLGGGLVADGELYIGDNSNATEIWLMQNGLYRDCIAEEGACIRAVQKAYAKRAGCDDYTALSPKDIEDIAVGKKEGNRKAAIEAYEELAYILGEVLANAATLFDSLIVIGGGLSRGHRVFLDSVIKKMNGKIKKYDGTELNRLAQKAYNLEDAAQFEEFVKGSEKKIKVYGSDREVIFDPVKRVGVGVSKLGTSEAVAVGAYCYALNAISKRKA